MASHAAANENAADNSTALNLLPRRKPTDRKRTWGIYYTPTELSRCLAEWAIRCPTDYVLEPSFGGCGFLNESARVLKKRGAKEPWKRLCGCDKDLRAFGHLPLEYRRFAPNRRFLHQNFLDTVPTDYCIRQFDVVLGNPPFVRRHNMRKYQISSAEAVFAGEDVPVSRRASLWAYFLFHSLKFLRSCGRMGWVLPRSLSQSDYGREVVRALCRQFESVSVISVQKQLFISHGSEELVDILLCESYHPTGQTSCHPLISYADSLPELQRRIDTSTSEQCALSVSISSGRENLLAPAEREAIAAYGDAVGFDELGDIATVKIGIVTGATRFFVLRRSDLADAKLTARICTPLLTRSAYVKGISWQQGDVADSIAANHRVLLVPPDREETKSYWRTFPAHIRRSVRTFRKRAVWNSADDGVIPNAFFFGMVHHGPRLVLNLAKTNSNNSIHRVYFNDRRADAERRANALLVLSSFGQLSGELVGRVLGAGGLKFEPSDARKLRIPKAPPGFAERMPTLWSTVELFLRNGKEGEAIERVDAAVQSCLGGALSLATVATVQSALQKLRRARKQDDT
jgi:hypothetical protein